MTRSYEIEPRPPEQGGGWLLRLLEDGKEAGRRVYPSAQSATANSDSYAWAVADGEDWLKTAGG
jgi:hypothetical protein